MKKKLNKVHKKSINKTIKQQKKDPNIINHVNDSSNKNHFLNGIFKDPVIPYVLSLYLKLIFNFILVFIFLYFIFIFIKTIKSDINGKLENHLNEISLQIEKCKKEYHINKCDFKDFKKVPELKFYCDDWKTCIHQDSKIYSKSLITAEIFAEIIDHFFKLIKWKSTIFLLVLFYTFFFILNSVFSISKQKNFETTQNLNLFKQILNDQKKNSQSFQKNV